MGAGIGCLICDGKFSCCCCWVEGGVDRGIAVDDCCCCCCCSGAGGIEERGMCNPGGRDATAPAAGIGVP